MDVNLLRKKTIHGAKWMILTSVLAIPLSYIVNVILGRISSEALGEYSVIQIFIQTLSTFVLFGGPAVLSNFLPKAKDDEERINISFTYLCTITLFFILFLIIIWIFPGLIPYIVGNFPGNMKWYGLFIFAPVYILSLFIQYVLTGILEIKTASFIDKLYSFFLPVSLGIFLIVATDFAVKYSLIIVFWSITAANAVGVIIGFYVLRQKIKVNQSLKFVYPKGFWKFSSFVHLSTIFSYAYNNTDKFFMLMLGSLGQLGIYQAVMTIWRLSKYIPQLLINVTVPLFSSLIGDQKTDKIKIAYEKIEKNCILFITLTGLAIITYSKIALLIFGRTYADFSNILILFIMGDAISSLSFSNTPLLISAEKNFERFIISTVQIAIQILLSFLLVKKYGVLGITIAKITGVIIANINLVYLVIKKLDFGIRIPRQYFVNLLVILSWGIVNLMFSIPIYIGSICFVLLVLAFLYFGDYKKKDFQEITELVVSKKIKM